MLLTAGDRPMMIVRKVWQPIPGRRLRLVWCRQGDWKVCAMHDRPVQPDALVTLERIWPFWFVAGVQP